jgi:hypothetical protein
MATEFLGNLIRYIVSEVQNAGGVIFRTRLVKLLYLCDVEYYRSRRQRITELDWKRYLYGPYAFELPEITKRMGLDLGEEELDFSTGRGIRYEVYDIPNPDNWLDPAKRLVVDRVIRRWGNEDLDLLLDYVYCDTEPMKDAQFLQPLDFRRITYGMRYSMSDSLDIADKDIEDIRKLIDKYGNVSRKPVSIKLLEEDKSISGDEPHSPKLVGKVQSKGDQIKMVEGRE